MLALFFCAQKTQASTLMIRLPALARESLAVSSACEGRAGESARPSRWWPWPVRPSDWPKRHGPWPHRPKRRECPRPRALPPEERPAETAGATRPAPGSEPPRPPGKAKKGIDGLARRDGGLQIRAGHSSSFLHANATVRRPQHMVHGYSSEGCGTGRRMKKLLPSGVDS